jgi:hypothetical protein
MHDLASTMHFSWLAKPVQQSIDVLHGSQSERYNSAYARLIADTIHHKNAVLAEPISRTPA